MINQEAQERRDAEAAHEGLHRVVMFGDGHSGTRVEMELPTAPRRRTGSGMSGVDVVDSLSHQERMDLMRQGLLGSVHSWELVTAVDGPGTRMTVFMNGCPLRCLYCHNPDTFQMRDGEPVMAEELMKKLKRYAPIFRASGGGVTFSGGECLQQPAFLARMLRSAQELGIHTCIDTSGYLGRALSDDMLRDTDLVLLDIKSGDPDTYRRVTGRDLQPTIDFAYRLAREGLPGGVDQDKPVEVWVRFVLVPGLTDDLDNVELVAGYAAQMNQIRPGTVSRVEVLPFHQLGRDKWAALGRHYELDDVRPPQPAETEAVRDILRAKGLTTF